MSSSLNSLKGVLWGLYRRVLSIGLFRGILTIAPIMGPRLAGRVLVYTDVFGLRWLLTTPKTKSETWHGLGFRVWGLGS